MADQSPGHKGENNNMKMDVDTNNDDDEDDDRGVTMEVPTFGEDKK